MRKGPGSGAAGPLEGAAAPVERNLYTAFADTVDAHWYLVRHHHQTLRTIENRVLEEVSIQRAWRAVGGALAVVLAGAALAWWLEVEVIGRESPHGAKTVSGVGVGALLVASVVSAVALGLRRYRWCCTAANCGALAAVIGIGVFWWVRTGQAEIELMWLVVADLVTVTLTVGWLAVILTPIEHSQPDMRRRGETARQQVRTR